MRNQTSFRLTTTLLPTDTTAKTTTVINKVDANGDKFYPSFTEETVVLTNDDRTVMETTRATCTDGVLTFVKRGLSDDASQTQVANRKLTWNPGTLCFITAGAGDWIDKDDDIIWTGDQTYTGDLTSTGTATYSGSLTTNGTVTANKGIIYPSFADLAALQAYANPFGGMFAVVETTGEIYRYNAVTENWSVVTTESPLNPEQATTSRIGTVRGATDAEFAAGTATGSNSELLVATPAQIQSLHPAIDLRVTDLGNDYQTSWSQSGGGAVSHTLYLEYTATRPGWLLVTWKDIHHVVSGGVIYSASLSVVTADTTAPCILYDPNNRSGDTYGYERYTKQFLMPMGIGKVKLQYDMTTSNPDMLLKFEKFFYYG